MGATEHTPAETRRLSTSRRTLADLRHQSGLSLREVGRKSGISNGLISLMERGLLIPSAEEIDALAAALNLPEGSVAQIRIEVAWAVPQ